MMPKTFRLAACVAVAAAMLSGTFAASARADDHSDGRRDGHGDRDRRDGGYYGAPPVDYAPQGYYVPPVVYAPGIGIAVPGVTINIR